MSRHRYRVLAVWLLLLVVGGFAYSTLDRSLGVPDYSVSNSESAHAEQLISDHFPALGAEQDVIVFRSVRHVVDDSEFKQAVDRVLASVKARSDITTVLGPYDGVAEDQISADRHTAAAVLGLRGDQAARAKAATDLQDRIRSDSNAVEVYLTGPSPLTNDLSDIELHDQGLAESIGIPVALAVLLIALGGLVAAMLPIVVALTSVLTCMGMLTLLAGPLHLDRFVTVITTVIGLGIGIDYALFVVSRFREEFARNGGNTAAAIAIAMRTSGRTIVTSGLLVIVALSSMLVFNGHIFTEIAFASCLVVACCLAAGLTLLPALLAVLGRRVNALSLRRRQSPTREIGRWGRWARFVFGRPVLLGLPAIILLVALALPTASIKLGLDLGLVSLSSTPSGKGQQIVASTFSPGSIGPVQAIACSPHQTLQTVDLDATAQLATSLRADTRISGVTTVTDVLDKQAGGHTAEILQATTAGNSALDRIVDHERRCTYLNIVLATPIDSSAANGFVNDLRHRLAPHAYAGTGVTVSVGGLTAQYADLSQETIGKLPLVVLLVLAVSFCYLLVVFRSILLPAKAIALNLLSTMAAVGLTVLVFQEGFGSALFGFASVGTLQAYLPVALFALLFGLSMDYEVFLVGRIQEEWLRSHDNGHAVVVAVDRTAQQITAGAAIMVAVFGSLLVARVLELKQFGFGLAIAVLMDATLIRLLLVPAIMAVARAANWWLPRFLERILPR